MFARLLPAAAAVVMIGWAASGQQPADPKSDPKADPKTEPKSAKADGPVFEIRLADDSLMKVVLLDPAVPLNTKYGRLNVPVGEIRRLEFGFRYPEGLEGKIDQAISELGATEFRDREAAEQALAEYGPYSVPALRRAIRSDNPEVVRRAASVLKLVESKHGAEKLELRDYDVVEAGEFTARGRLETTTLRVRTKYFGDVALKLTDIRTFRAAGTSSGAEFALDAAQYAKMNQSQWMETVIEVSSGQQLEVTASGQIDQWPQGPGQYMSGPAGLPGQGGGFVPGGQPRLGAPGAVIGRVGPNGSPFVIGASYKGKATENGKLYLRISPSPWNNDSAGSFKIKVAVE